MARVSTTRHNCRHPEVLAYLMRSLEACDPEEVAFFLPQLVQVYIFSFFYFSGWSLLYSMHAWA